MGKVLLFGEPMALLIADSVVPLEKVEHFSRSLSGAEVNVCIGLSRLGHMATYITRLGDDPFGHFIENYLRKENIGTEFVTYDDIYRTGIQLKSKVLSGDPVAPYYRKGSAASHLTVKEIDNIDFSDIQHVHITGIPAALSKGCRDATYRLFERAKENDVFITFDPNLRPALWESKEVMIETINDLSSKADMVLPGLQEGKLLFGIDNIEAIADKYQALGVKQIVIKDGSRGAYVRDGNESYTVKGFKVDKVVDTVGAGDGFAVGIISARLEGLSLREMVKRGNAIGAIQVTNIGDNEGLPMPGELKKFMKNKNLNNG
ncbi:MAG: sugar kinase [Clostridiaceae bacterium]